MARSPGRPPKPDASTIDASVRKIASELIGGLSATRRASNAAPAGPFRSAVLAVRIAEALEVFAAEEIDRVRSERGSGWAVVGEAFGVATQTAHARFRMSRLDLDA